MSLRALAGSLAALLLSANALARPPAHGPNIVLIVVDTLRADHLTQLGYPLDTSSALSLLTNSATRFDECYSPASWTAPAVASIFSGISPARHGVDRVGAALADEVHTLAEALRFAGWRTGAFSFNPHITRKARFDQGFDEFVSYRGSAQRAPDIRDMTREAWRWIEEQIRAGRTPFFLYLQPMNVHGPYRVPEDAAAILLGRPPAPGFEFFGPLMKGLMNDGRLALRDEVTPAYLQSLTEQYDTAIRHTTAELGNFFAKLDAAGLWDDSLVILTADHGEELFDHGGFSHRYSLHREVLHVPLFVKRPGQREARVVTEPVSLIDIHPTLLELVSVKAWKRAKGDGWSLVPFLTGDPAAPPAELRDRSFVSEATNAKRCVAQALRRGRHELIVIERNYEGVEQGVRLYDVVADPNQTRNLQATQPELVEELRTELEERLRAFDRRTIPRKTYPLSDKERTALELLGYL